ncbi:hypothetical protein BDF14DRAFT_1786688, partial [Spinellus fusiger]
MLYIFPKINITTLLRSITETQDISLMDSLLFFSNDLINRNIGFSSVSYFYRSILNKN